jgi:hypothetical protein
MNVWDWLDKRWPSERAWVTLALVALVWGLLQMAADNPGLWDVELFKTLLTASVVTGALNMVLAFHFTANKSDETKSENTAKAFEAITATAQAANTGDAADAAAGARQATDAAGAVADDLEQQADAK